MFDERVPVLENKKINEAYWKLTFRSKKTAAKSQPGHFINLRIRDSYEPLLRRPFSIYHIHRKDQIDVLYEVVGTGTSLMTKLKPGDEIDCLGPLGKGFSKPKKNEISILVGGGIGIAPLNCWDETYGADYFLMGYRGASHLLPREELRGKKSKKFVSTDDGSAGKKGLVTSVLETILEKEKGKKCRIYTCGPNVMMGAVKAMADQYQVPGELSTEEMMGCGVGACLGCVVQTKEGYKASCKEGPVFDFSEFENFPSAPAPDINSKCGCSHG